MHKKETDFLDFWLTFLIMQNDSNMRRSALTRRLYSRRRRHPSFVCEDESFKRILNLPQIQINHKWQIKDNSDKTILTTHLPLIFTKFKKIFCHSFCRWCKISPLFDLHHTCFTTLQPLMRNRWLLLLYYATEHILFNGIQCVYLDSLNIYSVNASPYERKYWTLINLILPQLSSSASCNQNCFSLFWDLKLWILWSNKICHQLSVCNVCLLRIVFISIAVSY